MIIHYQTAVIRFQCVHSWGEIPRVAMNTGYQVRYEKCGYNLSKYGILKNMVIHIGTSEIVYGTVCEGLC